MVSNAPESPVNPAGIPEGPSPLARDQARKIVSSSRTPSLKWKLMTILLITSGVTLMFVCVSLFAYDLHATRVRIIERLTGLAEVMSANVAGPLFSNEVQPSEEILETLRTQKTIRAACLFRTDGDLVAGYLRDHEGQPVEFPRQEWEGARFEAGAIRFYHLKFPSRPSGNSLTRAAVPPKVAYRD